MKRVNAKDTADFASFRVNTGFQDLPGVHNVAKVWRQGAIVGGPGCLGVGVGLWEIV